MGTLYLVATPIGNLEDISLRALRVLKEVGLIAAEDTRTTQKLLRRYEIKTPVTSYHEHNRLQKIPYIMGSLEANDVALVSDAGMPGISDPGYELVRSAIEAGIVVVPVPGTSAVTACLAVSGLPISTFTFLGFLPRRKTDRRRLLEGNLHLRQTLIAFEAPHRLHESLEDVLATLGDRRVAICRELTKLHEEVFRGSVSEALAHFSEPRGEFTLVIEGATENRDDLGEDWASDELRRLSDQGVRAKEAVAVVAQASGLPRRQVYRLWLRVRAPVSP